MLVLVVSIVPVDEGLPSVPHLDKVAHVGEYLLFAWLLIQAVRAGGMPEWQYRLWAWIYATSYGLLIELIQAFVPWRSADWADAVANAVGAALGVWIGQRLPKGPAFPQNHPQ